MTNLMTKVSTVFFILLVLLMIQTVEAWALPVVGEKIVSVGKAHRDDGDYEIQKTTEVVEYNSTTHAFTLVETLEQSAEGSPMGMVQNRHQVPEIQFQVLESNIHSLFVDSQCGEILNAGVPLNEIKTTAETLTTPIGTLQTCKMELPVHGNIAVTQWVSEETAPFPAKLEKRSLTDGTFEVTTVQSLTKNP